MLNEFKEVEAYLCNPDENDVRINPKLLSDGGKKGCKLNGLYDILTLIASYYMYDFCTDESNRQTLAEKTILILRIWCGFDGDVSEDELNQAKKDSKAWFEKYPQAEQWLKLYYNRHLIGFGSDWAAYSEEWRDSLNSNYVYRAKSLGYENILAQACARGPLKSYSLIIKQEFKNALKNEIKNDKGKCPGKPKRENMLKILAAYLVLQSLHPGQKYVVLQTNRILNWMGIGSANDQRWCLELTWRDEPIFVKDGDYDYIKLCVNQSFLNTMDVQLRESSLEAIPNGYLEYRDTGHGKNRPLKHI